MNGLHYNLKTVLYRTSEINILKNDLKINIFKHEKLESLQKERKRDRETERLRENEIFHKINESPGNVCKQVNKNE